MLIINKRKSRAGVTWCDYVKIVQNLERYAIDFSHGVRNLSGDLEDFVLHKWNVIEEKK